MKRLRSSEDLDSYDDRNAGKEPTDTERSASSSQRSFYHRNNFVRRGPISPSRYDRDRPPFLTGDDVSYRDSSRVLSRRRTDRDFDGGFENRRKELDNRYREDRLNRSESFCFTRRDFPRGFRSDRERPRRDGSFSSWRRFGGREKEYGVEERERVGTLRLRDGERNLKSPGRSRDSSSEQSRMRPGVFGESRDSRNSRSKSKSMASPTWSKDSGSEQSKSVGNVARRSEDEVQGKSGGSSSEMEEGELEPEPQLKAELGNVPSGDGNEGEEHVGFNADHGDVVTESGCREVGKDCGSDDFVRENKSESDHTEFEHDHGDRKTEDVEIAEGKGNVEEEKDVVKEADKICASDENLNDTNSANMDVIETNGGIGDEGDKEEDNMENSESKLEENSHVVVEEKLHLEEDLKQDEGIKLEVGAEENEALMSIEEAAEGNGKPRVCIDMLSDGLGQKCKDKGKSLVFVPSHVVDSTGDGVLIERETRNLEISRNQDAYDGNEGPSTRGFELFSSSPVRKFNKAEQSSNDKQKDEKLVLEPLDLSLSLPDVLLPIGGQDANVASSTPVCSRSARSLTDTFCTNSDGFTMSMSFSGSQSFHHNPSCSLNHNSLDNCEQSVHSRPIFQGIDWQALSHNDSKNKENPLYQRLSGNVNGSVHQPQALQGFSNPVQAGEKCLRVAEGSSKMSNGLEKQLSFHKQNDVSSPCLSMGSLENGSKYNYGNEKAKREMHGSSLKPGGDNFVETVINHILSEPMHVMSKKFHEMPGHYISSLKESIREMMLNMDKCGKLYAFQNALENRTDTTVELLRNCHRAQLEILVALRTRRSEFLQADKSVSSSDLAEIFVNLRCKNLTCRSLLPVDECDCKVCSKKDGFCSACMCLVCSNFDMASNTCSWVGCDVCLHWCHTDCGLRESYIRNGKSEARAQGTQMQFHCVACDHPSEMFGFVKEVFQNFSRDWKHERFMKELEYVKRIFLSSKDLRGKRLYEIAKQMLARLANESIDLSDVCHQIMVFLAECDSSDACNAPTSCGKEQVKASHEIAGPSQQSSWLKSVYSDKPLHLERSSSLLHTFHDEKQTEIESNFQRDSQKEPLFEELESLVRIKQAEAKMFQARADDARSEAQGLKQIAVAKKEKIEEEYMSRIARLRLAEAEELRKKKLEELQAVERAHRDYFSMKKRMEEDIRDLLMKMEASKRNLAL